MSNTSQKILVCGDVGGSFKQLFKRVASVNEKSGPFSLLLCVGEFFSDASSEWEYYKAGKLKVPIPTYILGPTRKETKNYYPDLRGCELAENVIYLGPSGIYPCSSGLTIAYLSGRDANIEDLQSSISFTFSDIKSLEVAAGNKPKIDLLITSEWPKGVFNHVKSPDGLDTNAVGSVLISRLAYKLKPRYHFVGLEGIYYERLPYRNHQVLKEPAHHVSRFIALANVSNSEKRKWLYAFNVNPIVHIDSAELNSQPADVTECPYPENIVAETEKYMYKKSSQKEKSDQFFYDMDSSSNNSHGQKRKDNFTEPMPKRPLKPTGPCWFCLASPEVEKHLVVSVGAYSYLALAKGGLVQDHLLILPIEHFQSTSDLEDDCRQEIEQFKSSLRKFFNKKGKVVVFFERNYRTQHLQIQVVPLPGKCAPSIKESFMDMSENSGFELAEVPKHSDIAQLAAPGTPFFYVELPNGEKLYHRIKKGFSLQFGREVLASSSLLNIPERIEWKDCKVSQSEETKIRDQIRQSFKPFDFTLDDDDESD